MLGLRRGTYPLTIGSNWSFLDYGEAPTPKPSQLRSTVVNDSDRSEMQENINQFMRWADTWQMQFNAKKCKVLHVGKSNPCFDYTMGGYAPAGTLLEAVSEEKDIGVIIHNSLKPSLQCAKAAKKANSVLGQMSRSVQYRDKYVWLRLYKRYVRPHLEFSVQAWSPWYKRDIELLEKVQRRALNMVCGLHGRTYEGKLKEVGLTTLAERRLRGDMIQVWKWIHKKSVMDPQLFSMVTTAQQSRVTRHTTKSLNIMKPKARLEIRKNFFTVRAVDDWNKLPAKVQNMQNIMDFKIAYDENISYKG